MHIRWIALLLLVCPPAARPDAGHDHSHEKASAAGRSLPRFTAASETFELVGVLDGRQLVVYLDRSADNSPVKDAAVELEIAGRKLPLKPRGEGEFEATLAQAPKAGVTPITATVVAGQETDLLAGELDLPEPPGDAAHEHGHGWRDLLPWALAGVAALAIAIAGLRRVRLRRAS